MKLHLDWPHGEKTMLFHTPYPQLKSAGIPALFIEIHLGGGSGGSQACLSAYLQGFAP